MTKQDLDSAYGIVYEGKGGKIEYLIANLRLRNAACGGLPAQRVFEGLRAAGMIRVQNGGKWSVTRQFPSPLKRARVISIKQKILSDVPDIND
jgi:hypothetical protein